MAPLDRNTDHRGRPYTLPPADPATLAPWLAPDGSGGLLIMLGVTPVATFSSSIVSELRAARAANRQYRVVLELM